MTDGPGRHVPGDLQVRAAIIIDLARALGRSDPYRDLGAPLPGPARRGRPRAPPATDRGVDACSCSTSSTCSSSRRGHGPLIVTLEDLHWADDLTLEILEALARRLPTLPLLVLATYRSGRAVSRGSRCASGASRLLTQRLAEEVRLRRLGAADTATHDGAHQPAPDCPAAERRRRRGPCPDGRDPAPRRGVPRPSSQPADLTTVAGDRAGRGPGHGRGRDPRPRGARSPRARRVAEAGAVIGRAFDVDLLAAVLGEAPDDLVGRPDRAGGPLPPAARPRHPGGSGSATRSSATRSTTGSPRPGGGELHRRTAEAAVDATGHRDRRLPGASTSNGPAGADDAYAAALAGATAATALSSHREARELYACALRTAPADLAPAGARPTARGARRQLRRRGPQRGGGRARSRRPAARTWRPARGSRRPRSSVPLVAARHLLGDGLGERSATAARRPGRASIRRRPAPPRGRRRSATDRVRARLLAALAAAYMLDRRLDSAHRLRARGPTAGRARRRRADRAERRDHARGLLRLRRPDGRGLGAARSGWSRIAARSALEAEAARAYRMLGSVCVRARSSTSAPSAGCATGSTTPSESSSGTTATTWLPTWATSSGRRAAGTRPIALATAQPGRRPRRGHDPGHGARMSSGYVALGRADADRAGRPRARRSSSGHGWASCSALSPAIWGLAELALQRGDAAGPRSPSPRTAWRPRPRSATPPTCSRSPSPGRGPTSRPAIRSAAARWLDRVEPSIDAASDPGDAARPRPRPRPAGGRDGATGQAATGRPRGGRRPAGTSAAGCGKGAWATDRPGPLPRSGPTGGARRTASRPMPAADRRATRLAARRRGGRRDPGPRSPGAAPRRSRGRH